MKKFEYQTVFGDVNTDLDEYGLNGWELCSAVQIALGEIVYYFKREKI